MNQHAPVLVSDHVIRRVQLLALECVSNNRDRAVVLVADDAAREVFAGQLASLVVETVAVAVVRRASKHRHVPVVFHPPHLPVVRDVAPEKIAALAVPCRPLGPERAGPDALYRGIRLRQPVERRVHREHVRVGEVGRRRGVRPEVARRVRNYRGRRLRCRLRLRSQRVRNHHRGPGDRTERPQQPTPRHFVVHSDAPFIRALSVHASSKNPCDATNSGRYL